MKDKIDQLLNVRRVVTGAIEVQRRDKVIRSSLEAKPHVYIEDSALRKMVENTDFADFVITSDIEIHDGQGPDQAFRLDDVEGVSVTIDKAEGEKCERCWKITTDVGENDAKAPICKRCADVVEKMPDVALSSVA